MCLCRVSNEEEQDVTPKPFRNTGENPDNDDGGINNADNEDKTKSSGQIKYKIQLLENLDIPKLGDGMVSTTIMKKSYSSSEINLMTNLILGILFG